MNDGISNPKGESGKRGGGVAGGKRVEVYNG